MENGGRPVVRRQAPLRGRIDKIDDVTFDGGIRKLYLAFRWNLQTELLGVGCWRVGLAASIPFVSAVRRI